MAANGQQTATANGLETDGYIALTQEIYTTRAKLLAGGTLTSVALTGLALAAIALRAEEVLRLTPLFALKALLAFLLGSVLLLALASKQLRGRSFGAANQVTLARGALVALLLGLLGERAGPGTAWFAVAVASLALASDGLDGWLARRRGTASSFGARFDMETDALLILVLAALVWQLGQAGAWVLLAGLMRYAFVGAARLLPWMRRALPYSRRRQTICVVQVLVLIVCVGPLLEPPLSSLVALLGLGLLTGSFAVDFAWLARHAAR